VTHHRELVNIAACLFTTVVFAMQTDAGRNYCNCNKSTDPQQRIGMQVKPTQEASKEEGQVTILLCITKVQAAKFLGTLDVEGDVPRPTHRAQRGQ